ncbi:TPA: nucleotidyltransferase domain-containing protein [Candidatus Woesearchaeota archaeon]|nr:nucleotidyltransferase domain-containing protein [Candidatus Woesearchaeota archaeon]HII69408.1 nucleotidyltransferase domain-containing protein [Candidatus Woesearchaeota archaeon]
MILNICMGNRTAWKIFSVFAEAPGKSISRAEIKRLTSMGNKAMDHAVTLLLAFGMVSSKKSGKKIYYTLNLSSAYSNGLIDLVRMEKEDINSMDFRARMAISEFVYALTNEALDNLVSVYAFGSYVKRTYRRDSDIDLALITKEKKPGEEIIITSIGESTQSRFGIQIQPHYFTQKEFNRSNSMAREVLIDGVKLL